MMELRSNSFNTDFHGSFPSRGRGKFLWIKGLRPIIYFNTDFPGWFFLKAEGDNWGMMWLCPII